MVEFTDEELIKSPCTVICEHCGKVVSGFISSINEDIEDLFYKLKIEDIFGNKYIACPHCGEKFHSFEIIEKEKKENEFECEFKEFN